MKGGEFIPARTVIWAAGNAASPLGKTLGAPVDKAGRVVVNEDLTIPGHPEVQVIGDMANFSHQTGKPLPGVSPTAMQEGRHAAQQHPGNARGRQADEVPSTGTRARWRPSAATRPWRT